MKKELVVLCLILLLITSCKPTPENPQQSAAVTKFVKSGNFGLELKFVDNMPPNQVFDTSGINALVEVRNVGSYDIKNNECYLQFGGSDTNILRGINHRQSCGDLEGKSALNLEGGFDVIEYKTSSISLPEGTPTFNAPIQATACYEYQTVATPQICVDSGFYEITGEQKA